MSDKALAVALVLPRRVLGLPLTVMTPLASTEIPLTYLEICVSHALGYAELTSAWDAVLTVSVTAVLHCVAVSIISETLARTA